MAVLMHSAVVWGIYIILGRDYSSFSSSLLWRFQSTICTKSERGEELVLLVHVLLHNKL